MTADRRELLLGALLSADLRRDRHGPVASDEAQASYDAYIDALLPLVYVMCAEAAADALIHVGATALAARTPGTYPVLVPVSQLFDLAEQLHPSEGDGTCP